MLSEHAALSNQKYRQLLAMSAAGVSLGNNASAILGHTHPQGGQYLSRAYYNTDPHGSPSGAQYLTSNSSVALSGEGYRQFPSPQTGSFPHGAANQINYLPVDTQDVRSQFVGGRPSLTAATLVNNSQAYQNLVRPQSPPLYPSVQGGGQSINAAAAAAAHQAHLLQVQRAELASVYPRGHNQFPAEVPAGRGPRLGPLNLHTQDPFLLKDDLVSGALLNGHHHVRGSTQFLEPDFSGSRGLDGHFGALGPLTTSIPRENLERYLGTVGQPETMVNFSSNRMSPERVHKWPRYSFEFSKFRRESPRNNDRSPYRGRRRSGRSESSPRDRGVRSNKTVSARSGGTVKPSEGLEKTEEKKTEGGVKSEGLAKTCEAAIDSAKQQNGLKDGKKKGGSRDNENVHNSDKASELSSMASDPSDSIGGEKKKEEGHTPEVVDEGPLAGMIFGCSSITFHECMKLRLFGLPAKNKREVMRVIPGTKLFLFNFDTKELSGIFEAVSDGGMWIDQDAFRDFGSFPAQVKVDCTEMCPNLPMSQFKDAIQDNFFRDNKFKFDLNAAQVGKLKKMFRAEARARVRRPRERGRHRDYMYIPALAQDLIL